MTTHATPIDEQDDKFGSGLAGAIALHVLLVGVFIAVAYFVHTSGSHFGESTSSVGAIQASMVSAIPLPQKFKPVDKSVLAPEHVSAAPAPPPKEATIPPPRDTDILVKARTPPTKLGPIAQPAPPRHPQPTPPTAKAQTGESAMQLPEATIKTVNGTATVTVQSRTLGQRYSWYIRLISDKVQQSYSQQYPDPRSSLGRSVTITFYVDPSGTPTHVQVLTPSGSPTLDDAGKRAVEEIDTFGPNPSNQQIPIEFTFNYGK